MQICIVSEEEKKGGTFADIPLTQHNYASKHGRRQSKKEFNAYLAAEAKNGNYGPAIIWFVILFAVTMLLTAIQK